MDDLELNFMVGIIIGIIWIFRRKMNKMKREMQAQIDELKEHAT